MFPRVIAVETEYGDLTTRGGKPYSLSKSQDQKLNDMLKYCLPEKLKPDLFTFPTGNIFLMNGARLYLDTGFHEEYAAQEGCGPREAMVNELAGGRTMEEMAELANLKWQEEKFVVRFIKNNLDGHSLDINNTSSWHSWGSHDNYQIRYESLRKWLKPGASWIGAMAESLSLHFITRMLYGGSGWVGLDNKKLCYLISQRGLLINTDVSGSTTSSRPIITSRNEPHADATKWGRLHIISGDSLMLEPAILLKLGTTDILIDAVEEGFLRKCPCGVWDETALIKALHTFTKDPSLRAVCKDAEGKKHTIVSIQKAYRDVARKFVEKSGHINEDRRLVLDLWDKILDAASSPRPHEKMARDVDWACKKVLTEEKMERKHFNWKTKPDRIIAKNNRGEDLTALGFLKSLEIKFQEESRNGLARIFTARGFAGRISSEEEIQSAQSAPRPTTRAFARHRDMVRLHEFAKKKGFKLFLRPDWTYIVARKGSENHDIGDVIYSSVMHRILDPLNPYPYLPDIIGG